MDFKRPTWGSPCVSRYNKAIAVGYGQIIAAQREVKAWKAFGSLALETAYRLNDISDSG
jgi:hypothetical protein